MAFTATFVTCVTQDNVIILGFADKEFQTSQYVMLQKEISPPSAQDRLMGLDKPHIEIDSQAHSGYGGVVRAVLRKNGLVLELDPQAARKMSVDETIEIVFDVSTERLTMIADQLRLLFGNEKVQFQVEG